MSDGLLGFGRDEKEGTFYGVERIDSDISLEFASTLLSATMLMDKTEEHYERKVYNFFDLFGQLGGLYEILTIGGGIFVAFFAEKILMLSLISNLYQVEDKTDILDPPLVARKLRTPKVKPVNFLEEEKHPNI
jgi:hypothetical protein